MLIIIYCLLFFFITWWHLHLGLALLFLLLSTYLIRFSIGHLPTTLLESMTWVIFVVWLYKIFIWEKNNPKFPKPKKHTGQDPITVLCSLIKKYKLLFISIALFLIAATFSIFTATDLRSALGEWKAFYVEPFLIFLVLLTTITAKKQIKHILMALLLGGLATSLLAIYQHFTGWMVPEAFWANRDTFRVTAWYGFPNGVGLFLAPLIPLALYIIQDSWKHTRRETKHRETQDSMRPKTPSKFKDYIILGLTLSFLFSSVLAIFYAKSTGGLVGLAGGIGFLLLSNKKTFKWTIGLALAALLILMVLPSSNPIKQELFLQDRSGQIRISIWKETGEFLKDNPILGAGLASYSEKIKPYHRTVNGEGIEIFHHPHNIFLTMWVNLGLLGLAAFVGMVVWFFYKVFFELTGKNTQIKDTIHIYTGAAMFALLITGLVDSPYIKNDLALLFWLLPGLLVASLNLKEYEAEDVPMDGQIVA